MPVVSTSSTVTNAWQTDVRIDSRRAEYRTLGSSVAPEIRQSPTIVTDWDGPTDPENPQNWSVERKSYVTALLVAMAFCYSMSTSIFSVTAKGLEEQYGVSHTVAMLAVSLFALVSWLSQTLRTG
jgi:hypothetical protein